MVKLSVPSVIVRSHPTMSNSCAQLHRMVIIQGMPYNNFHVMIVWNNTVGVRIIIMCSRLVPHVASVKSATVYIVKRSSIVLVVIIGIVWTAWTTTNSVLRVKRIHALTVCLLSDVSVVVSTM